MTNHCKRIERRAIAVAVVIVTAAVAVYGQSTGDKLSRATVVRTAYAPFIGGLGLYLMKKEGIDKKNGIDLQIGAYGATSTLMSVMTGDVDIAFATLQSYMTSINALVEEGSKVSSLPKIVYLHNESRGADGIVSKLDIKTIADLKGKRVSAQFGTVTHYMLAKALQKGGLSIEDVQMIDMGPGKGGSAFIAGNLDAATTFEPYLSKAKIKGGNILITTKDMPRTILDVIVVSAKVAKERPEWLAKTLKAIDESTVFCSSNLNKAADETKDVFESSNDEVKSMYKTVYLYTAADNKAAMADGGWLYSTMKDAKDFYVSIKAMSPSIDFSQLVDKEFLPAN
jgi:NitT/TauT family transport system substrate-binding protein